MSALTSAVMFTLLALVPIGIMLYVALVVAIPACRLVEWLAGDAHDDPAPRR